MPMLFAPTIGAAITARHWFLWVRGPGCRTINAACADAIGIRKRRHLSDDAEAKARRQQSAPYSR